jgi:hypothetical protein
VTRFALTNIQRLTNIGSADRFCQIPILTLCVFGNKTTDFLSFLLGTGFAIWKAVADILPTFPEEKQNEIDENGARRSARLYPD